MHTNDSSSRRRFLKTLGSSTLALAAAPLTGLAAEEKTEERIIAYQKKTAPSDKIRLGAIGMGIMGYNDVRTALKVPGVELVAACDLYKGRLEHAREVFGKDLWTTNDFRALLERKDIDAVIVATSDHWHARIAEEALKKEKAVYCEKPMIHRIAEGAGLVAAQQHSGKTLQVGSQRVSSIVYAKAKELYKSGEIGKLNMVEASFDRQSVLGAWEYTLPTDVSRQTVDWDRYIAGTPKIPFDPKKFFWWRNYRNYGTGVAGDLFVHLISGVHVITGSKGPHKIFSSGQLSYWKDGRDVPDVMTAVMDYPETPEHPSFQLMLRVNFISGEGDRGSVKLVGEEGVIDIGGNGFTVRHSLLPKAPGIGGWDALGTYPNAMQESLKAAYNQKWSAADQQAPRKDDVTFKAPREYDEHLDHFMNFFESVRTGRPVVEDAVFGFRAAAPCLACNDSYFEKRIVHWDPVAMKLANA